MLNAGDMFGDYRVVRRLGKGGMCEVWLLEIESRHEFCAVKVLDPEIAARDRDFVRRFVKEAEFAMQFLHPNLVSVFDVGEDPDTGLCYIIMEYLPGGSLKDILQSRGALSVSRAVLIATDIARALGLAGDNGIVHRDVKPGNVMFAADGTAKLADLGVARFAASDTKTAATVTSTGEILGTPAYMAPEQMLDAHEVDIRADIYSLGIVLFEMVAGRRPYEGLGTIQLLAKAVQGEPVPDVRQFAPETPEWLAKLIADMTAVDKHARPRSPWVVRDRLVGGAAYAAPVASKRPHLPPRRATVPAAPVMKKTIVRMPVEILEPRHDARASDRIALFALVAVCVLAGVVAYYRFHEHEHPPVRHQLRSHVVAPHDQFDWEEDP